MSIKEFIDVLAEELPNEGEVSSKIRIFKAKRKVFEDEKNQKEDLEILKRLDGYSISEQIKILNDYLNQNNSSMNNDKGMSYTFNNPSVPKLFSDESDGHINIILLSISLIALATIIFIIIFI